ncbi:aminodeoxychorismate synthase component I [Endozoicomonas sp. G2_1]|uniref:aminodeoxychorismate synthase component I n=1 Tax=Endozoicomonas sp. G2_1 TaxID=2821091 RepID=UPI001ADC6498|nr:aminodeoxychorismate synthase component I [Endozoicomonas sp. G2_1]
MTIDNTSVKKPCKNEADNAAIADLIANLPNVEGLTDSSPIHLPVAPEQVFAKLADQAWAIWLDSCDSDHPNSRFDIMVWQPLVTITTTGSESVIHCHTAQSTTNNKLTPTEIRSALDPLALVDSINQQLFSPQQHCQQSDLKQGFNNKELPFKGGAVGYFAYDLGRRFETLPTQALQDLEQADMAVGFYHQALFFDRKQSCYYLIAESDKLATLVDWFEQMVESESEPKAQDWQQQRYQSNAETKFSLTSQWQANMTESAYREKFAQVQDYLLSGDCYQINLAQRFQAQYQGDEFDAYLALRRANQAPFSAFMRFADHSVLSISPERFLQVEHSANGIVDDVIKVQTKPIKGTRPRSQNPVQDQAQANELKHASKDRAENLMIVDLLRNDISKVCLPGTVKVPELFAIESFPAVHHLVSTVEGQLSPEHSAADLLRGAFPGGSITGAPKIRAMEIIEQLEPHRRNLYCGAIGYISACGNMDTSITIRTLVCKNQQIYCWAGGGLVADSQVDSEYQETFDKVKKILPVLSEHNTPL